MIAKSIEERRRHTPAAGVWYCRECGHLEPLTGDTSRFCPKCYASATEENGDFMDPPMGYVCVTDGVYMEIL